MKKLELNDQDIKDLQHALITAMKEYDKHGDTKIANRLEVIKQRVDELES